MAEDIPPKVLAFPAPLGTAGKPPSEEGTKRGPGRPKGSTNRPTTSVLQKGLEANFAVVGTIVYGFNAYDGQVILAGSEDLSKALVNLADQNPKVRRALENMLKGSTYIELMMALAAIVLPIAANHNALPGGLQTLYGSQIPNKAEPPEEAVAA